MGCCSAAYCSRERRRRISQRPQGNLRGAEARPVSQSQGVARGAGETLSGSSRRLWERKYGQYWEPIPFSKYLDPASFYKPPTSVKDIATRQQCVKCHTDESPGWVAMWKRSAHANLDKIRKLTPKDDTYYKKAKLEAIETNLRSLGQTRRKRAIERSRLH